MAVVVLVMMITIMTMIMMIYDDDDDGKNEDAGTCRTLSRLWSLAELEGCFPQEASYSRSPENDNDINGDDDTAKDYDNRKKRKKGKI